MALSIPGQQQESESECRRQSRKRRRPAVTCTVCRKRKIRCNREYPCNNCTRSKDAICVYEDYPPLKQRSANAGESTVLSGQTPPGSTGNPPSITTSSTSTAPYHIGTPLSTTTATTNLSIDTLIIEGPTRTLDQSSRDISAAPLTRELPDPAQCRQDFFGEPRMLGRTMFHKSRQFGQSHWMNGVAMFGDLLHLVETYMRKEPTVIPAGLRRCKALAKVIKSSRVPAWPTPLSDDLPPRDVVEHLIDNYLGTIESVYRIVHIPTFKRQVAALWTSPSADGSTSTSSRRDTAFMVQLKLILAIGATYDQNFGLRASATRWVYEAQTWLNTPNSKIRLNVQSLQIYILLIVARELVDVCGDLTWISAGELYRRAIYMGLNRDPPNPTGATVFATEMRRRLWNTILEISLQSSMCSGGPVLVSPDDFDTKPPTNLDDVQLEEKSPTVWAEDVHTQVSTSIALRKSFSVRLAVVKFLNDLRANGRYEQMLQIDGELRVAYKALTRTLQGMLSPSWKRSVPNNFEILSTDLMMNRYLMVLHVPFFEQSMHEAAYAYSRKVVLEAALKIWYMAYGSSSQQVGGRGIVNTAQSTQSQSQSTSSSSSSGPTTAVTSVSGYGFYPVYRSGVFQASCLVAAELRAQLEERDDAGMGFFTPLRPDLLPVVQEAKAWCLHGIRIGETNIKGYLFSCLIASHIDALMRGMDKNEIPGYLLQNAEQNMRESIAILKDHAGVHTRSENHHENGDEAENGNGNGNEKPNRQSSVLATSTLVPFDETLLQEDILFTTPDGMFDFDDMGLMEWGFNDDDNNNNNGDAGDLAGVSFW